MAAQISPCRPYYGGASNHGYWWERNDRRSVSAFEIGMLLANKISRCEMYVNINQVETRSMNNVDNETSRRKSIRPAGEANASRISNRLCREMISTLNVNPLAKTIALSSDSTFCSLDNEEIARGEEKWKAKLLTYRGNSARRRAR